MIEAIKSFIKMINPNSDLDGIQTNKQMLQELNFTQGDHSKLFANYIGSLIQIIENHIQQLNYQEKYQFVDLIITSVEVFPSMLKKNLNRVQRLFDLICMVMANIPEVISPNWFKPPPQYNEQDLDKLCQLDPQTGLICKFRTFIDRIGFSIGYMKMINVIQQKCYSYYNNGDWRFKSAVLMCISQLSEGLDLAKIQKIISLIKLGLVDTHPKVRFAAVQALGQFSDDLKPDFQEKYFNQLMPIIINGFNDQVERVSAHWMACMTNFIQDYTQTITILPYVSQIMNSICKFIQNGSITSKQNSVSALASLVTIPSLFDKNSIKKPFEICHSILQVFSVQTHKQLVNQAFQCITIAISTQPYLLVQDYYTFVIEIMNQLGDKMDSDYFVAGWHRVCNTYHKFQNWQVIFKKIMQITKSLQTQQTKPFLNAIISTIECFKEEFYQFSIETLAFVQQNFQKAISLSQQQVAISSIQTIQQIVNKAKPANPDPNWDNSVKLLINSYIQKISEIIQNQLFNTSQKILNSIKEMLVNYTFLYSDLELVQLCNHFWNVVDQLQSKKLSIFNNQLGNVSLNDQNNGQIDQQILKQQNQVNRKFIDGCKLQIPDIIQTISKNFKDPTQIIAKTLQKVSLAITNFMDEQDLRYAVYYIDNLLQNYSYEVLKLYWQNFYKYLSQFSCKQDAPLRNSAAFGIGILAQKTPNQLVTMNTIYTWLEVVKTAYSVPKKSGQTQKVYGHCQDNCVAVVGKILKRFNKLLDLKFLYQRWLQVLPLKYDHEQNRIQINYLCFLLDNEPQALINMNNIQQAKTRLKRIFRIYGDLVCHLRKKKVSGENEKLLKNSKKTLLNLVEWPICKQNQYELTKDLNENQKFQLKELLTNSLIFTD